MNPHRPTIADEQEGGGSDAVVNRVPILAYHGILDDDLRQLPQGWSAQHTVSLQAFRAQLDILVAEGWQAIAPDALRQPALPPKCVVITFDDGHSSDLLAAQELERRGLSATFFITWLLLEHPNFLSRIQVLELGRKGFGVGSHGLNHVPLTGLSPRELRRQLVGSKKQLESLLRQPVTDLAVPYGAYDSEVIAAATAAGYGTIMTSDFTVAVAGGRVMGRLGVESPTTLKAFRQLLSGRWVSITRQRVINGLARRAARFRAASGF
jgi:peptidoglycan/xylan/chitin deacetylase (PgdA/CDA1 family)